MRTSPAASSSLAASGVSSPERVWIYLALNASPALLAGAVEREPVAPVG